MNNLVKKYLTENKIAITFANRDEHEVILDFFGKKERGWSQGGGTSYYSCTTPLPGGGTSTSICRTSAPDSLYWTRDYLVITFAEFEWLINDKISAIKRIYK